MRPETDDWMGEVDTRMKLWAETPNSPPEFFGAVMNVLGKYGVHRFMDHAMFKVADLAQTVVLRRLGDEMARLRDAHKDQPLDDGERFDRSLMLRQFVKPTTEEVAAAKDWLWQAAGNKQ